MAPPRPQSELHVCAALQQYADRDLPDAVVDVDEDHPPLSGRALAGAVAALGRALPLAPGDRCALLGAATSAYLVALLAAADAGAVACPLNWRWSAEELARALAAVAPRAVLADAALLPLLRRALELLPPAPAPAPPPAAPAPPPAPAVFVLARDGDAGAVRAAARAGTTTTGALAAAVARQGGGGGDDQPRLQLLFAPPTAPPSRLAAATAAASSPPGSISPDALCVFTSGTTAAPKPARLSHAAVWAQSRAKLGVVGYSPDDVYLHLAPLFHIGGLSSAHAALAAGARHALLARFSPRGAARAIARVRGTAIIAVPAMLADLLDAAEEEEEEEGEGARGGGASARRGSGGGGGEPQQARPLPPLASLRRVLLGAGAAPPELLSRCLRALPPQAGVFGAYGMTEACSSLTFADLRAGMPDAPPSPLSLGGAAAGATDARGGGALVCVGRAAPGVELAIALLPPEEGAASGPLRRAPEGVVGEVLTRGPHVMSGYHVPQVDASAARAADAAAFARLAGGGGGGGGDGDDGLLWLRTGDAGVLARPSPSAPDGSPGPFLYLAGRLKECIRSGGENVFAPEVEAALRRHPAVARAAAVGLPDARLGEAVAAAVVLRPGWAWRGGADAMVEGVAGVEEAAARVVSAAALRAFCSAAAGASGGGGGGGHGGGGGGGGRGGGAGLSRFKAPRAVAPVAELPLDPLTGKIARRAVREALLRALAERAGDGGAASAGDDAAGVGPRRSRL